MPTISGGQTSNLQSLSRQGLNPSLRQWKIKENHNVNNESAQEHMLKTRDPKANSAALEKLTRQRAPLMVPIGE